MTNNPYKWEILSKVKNHKSNINIDYILDVLLKNRGITSKKQKNEFFNPTHPFHLSLKKLCLDKIQLDRAIRHIDETINSGDEIIIYGDYDADGICATAILWETLYSLSKNVRPYIPNRFEEGYGLNTDTISKLKIKYPNLKLIVTVDNGIVAFQAIEKANELGIDVIVTDHHQKEKKYPEAHSIIHTDKISGSGLAWIIAREIRKKLQIKNNKIDMNEGLELAAIGTTADQLPLLGVNRSFVKYGLVTLNNTKRSGLLALFEESAIKPGNIGTYEVNFVIAPRINAMGRLEDAIDSLRLLCTKNGKRARELANILGLTNSQRQKIVEEVVLHARQIVQKKPWKGVIVVSHESFHEGVIGLAASKLVEEFQRPAIVISKGDKISKASARSITGFNIIESIRSTGHLILGGGGHPMAAGFSIETEKIDMFRKELVKSSSPLLTDEVLTKKLKIDMEIDFGNLSHELVSEIEKFEPTGIGNYAPVFTTKKTNVVNFRTVGTNGKHLKLTLEKDGFIFNAIAFGKGSLSSKLTSTSKINIVYNFIRDLWNGNHSLQLKIKDMLIV